MEHIRILGTAEQVADRLAAILSSDATTAKVPSCRELAESANVSVPTAMKALRMLEAQGLLARGGAGSRYQRLTPPDGGPERDAHRLLLVRPSQQEAMDGSTRLVVDRILVEVSKLGWSTEQAILAYGPDRHRPDRRWDTVVKRFQPQRMLVAAGTPLIASWAATTGVPTAFLGGTPGSFRIPTLGVSLSANLARLLPALIADGERHISLPVCGYGVEFFNALRARFEQIFNSFGLPFVASYHVPATTARGRTALTGLLSQVLHARPPGVLIFANARQFLAALGQMEHAGLVMGRNVKVAVLSHDPILDWMEPQPASFRYPLERFHRIIFRWLRNPSGPLFAGGGPIHLKADFTGGCGITLCREPDEA